MIDVSLLKTSLFLLGTEISDETAALLDGFSSFVLEKNALFNLTAISDPVAFTEKHLIDSLSSLRFIPFNASLCDVGSGAGFPAFPIAAVRKDVSVTALDSTSKKTDFISSAAKKFGVDNLFVLNKRAEECTHERGSFDVVTARAVAPIPILCELALPLVKTGGIFIAYKTEKDEKISSRSLSLLGGEENVVFDYTLPSGDKRRLIVFKKTTPTAAEYPREFGRIKKHPLL